MVFGNRDGLDLVLRPLPGDTCKVVLVIIERGEIADEVERYRLLIDKLASYVGYVASEEFASKHPGVAASEVLIRVLCATPPNGAMRDIEAVRPRGDNAGRVPVVFELRADFLQRLGVAASE